jgi:hypothetical protein
MKKIAVLTLLSTIPSSNEFLNRCMLVPKNPLLKQKIPFKIYEKSNQNKEESSDNRKKNLLKLKTELLREKTNDVFNSDCDALKKLIPAKANFWCRLDYHQMDVTHKAFESDSEPLKKLITDNVHRWHTLDSHTMFMIKDAYTSGHAIDIKWESN